MERVLALGGCFMAATWGGWAAPVGTTTGQAVSVNGLNIVVDFEEYYAGTFIDTEYATSGADAGGVSVGMPSGFGFRIVYTGSSGNVGIGATYDTDRRQYNDGDGNALDAPIYNNVVSIIANSQGDGMVGEDEDLEFDTIANSAPGTTLTNTYGPGTDSSWLGGNLSGGGSSDGTRVGNVIMLQENATAAELNNGHLNLIQGNGSNSNALGSSNAPDDGGSGTIRINFETPVVAVSFDWVDFEETAFQITFVDGTASARINFSEFSTGGGSTSNLPANPGGTGNWKAFFGGLNATTGDGYANRIDLNSSGNRILTADRINEVTTTASSLAWSDGADHESWDAVIFTLTGSGGLGVVSYTVIPEPSTWVAGAFLCGAAGLGWWKSRRKRR